MGVKPQTDGKKAAVLSKLALWLSGEECQAERFEDFGWGPSNKNVQASEAVQADPSLVAFAAQAEFGTPQGQIAGGWWDIAKVVATAAKAAKSDADLQAALDDYYDAISALTNVTETPDPDPDYTPVYGVVGDFNNWANDGGVEVMMTKQADGSYKSDEAIELAADEQIKVRLDNAWDTSWGGDGPNGNYVVAEAGTYYVVITFDADGNGTITLVPAEA